MFIDQIAQAIGSARTPALDALMKAVTDAWGAEQLTETDAQTAFALIEARRDRLKEVVQLGFFGASSPLSADRPPLPRSRFPEPRYQPARPHPERMIRRKRLAATGPLPPQLVGRLTTAQLSVLSIVSDEAGTDGQCALYLDEIAARAGVCRTTARNAIKEAERRGLITRTERRRPGRTNLTTVLRIVSREWRMWIQHGGKRGKRHRRAVFDQLRLQNTGVKKTSRTDRLRQRTNGQPLESPPNGPSGGLRPPPTAALAARG